MWNNNLMYHGNLQQLKRDDNKLYAIVSNIKNAQHIYAIQIMSLENMNVASIIVVTTCEYNETIKEKVISLGNTLSILIM